MTAFFILCYLYLDLPSFLGSVLIHFIPVFKYIWIYVSKTKYICIYLYTHTHTYIFLLCLVISFFPIWCVCAFSFYKKLGSLTVNLLVDFQKSVLVFAVSGYKNSLFCAFLYINFFLLTFLPNIFFCILNSVIFILSCLLR